MLILPPTLPLIITKLPDSPIEGETNPLGMIDVGSVIDLRYPKSVTTSVSIVRLETSIDVQPMEIDSKEN